MVEALNDEGFLAPEGGEWVLSQLQKVLERIELNEIALSLAESFAEFESKTYTLEQMVKSLRAMNARSLGHEVWDENMVQATQERLACIQDVINFNHFLVDIYPQMLEFEASGMSDEQIAAKFNQEGLHIPERVLWEIEQQVVELPAGKEAFWEASDVDVMRSIATRRKQDIDSFVHPSTLQKSIHIVHDDVADKKS